ncbi:MAG: carboxypeptidase regulatory-like domain-containing protein [Pirellulaceae bacterium]|nr:hypothetical protein [Thermoguttaceae bacterium]NLZ01325.1 carboxypeptidase regulatory-like domain-containing protein [Pirellulaceae bacterium]
MTTSLLGLALAGVLVWTLWWWLFLPRVHVFGLPVVHYDALAVPPVPFAEEDAARLTSPPPLGPKSNSRQALVGLETCEGMATLAAALRSVAPRSRDVVVLYLCGHGVSEGGKPLLLCSNYLPADDSGRIELAEVLRQVSACPARLKLVLLDAGWLAADFRQGMIVNEFARLVRAEVESLQDGNLWLLASHGPLETSHATYPDQASVFGHFVTKGLAGLADKDGDHVVELDEFYAFVRERVASRVSAQTGGAATQTPELLRGGIGLAEPDSRIALVSVPPAEAAQGQRAAPEQPPPQGPATGGENPQVAEAGQQAADAPPPTPPAAPAAGRDAARAEVLNLLQDAWRLRDRLQSRDNAAEWTPVDYAPHIWREFQELLLGYEMQFRDRRTDAKDLASDLEILVAPLRLLVERQPLPQTADPSSVLARLERAGRQTLGKPPPAESPETAQITAAYGEAIRLRNDLLFACPYYVRWYGRAAGGAPFAASLHDHLSELLAEQLPQYGQLLGSTATAASATETDFDSRLRQIQLQTAALNGLRDRIEDDLLAREVQAILGESEDARKPEELSQRIVDLLATPILAAAERTALLAVLEELRGRAVSGDTNLAVPAGARPAWSSAAAQAALAVNLVRLFDPASAKELADELAAVGSRPAPHGQTDDASLWEAYRKLGGGLAAFYRSLPGRIREEINSSGTAAHGRVELLLRAVDARDSVRVPAAACDYSIVPTDFRLPRQPLELTGPERLEIEAALWTEFSVALRAAGAEPGGASLSLQYDESVLTVEGLDKPGVVAPGRPMPVSAEQPKDVGFRVRSAAEQPSWETADLIVHLTSGQTAKTHRVQLAVRPPDRVDLLVAGSGLTVDPRSAADGAIRLRPFPNRTTPFRLELVNRSGKAKKVSVVLLGSPPGDAARPMRSAEQRAERLADWLAGGRPLAGPLDLELAAEQEPAPIPFPAEKPASDGPSAAPKDGQTAAEPAEPVDLTQGLLCVVRETQEKQWVHWIAFSALLPKDYLDPLVSYRAASQRVSIRVQAKDIDGDGQPDRDILPPTGPDQPIRVKWETAGVLDPNTEMNDQGRIVDPSQSLDLFAVVEPAAGRRIPIRLTVDGCRRAFLYDAVCDRDRQRIERERSVRSVSIRAPEPGAAFLAPREELLVELQVDAPEDAFQQPGDCVEVGIDANGDRLLVGEKTVRFESDRREEIFLDKLEPGGLLQVAASVGDLRARLDPGGLRNLAVDILAQLSLPTISPATDRSAAEAAVRVILDGAAPELRVTVPDHPVAKGSPILVSAETQDLSGVEKLEVGFDLDGSSDFEEQEAPKVLQQPGGAESWTTSLPTEDLEPGRYRILVRGTDRVGLSRSVFAQVSIVPPAGPAEPAKKTTSTIRGSVVLIDRPAAGISVRLEGTGLEAVSDSAGRFVFPQVPHGSYTLRAKGIALNKFREGSAQITLPAATEPAEIVVPVR